MVSFEDYKGREQSYVKHVLLEQYLEALIHKTASAYPKIVYVDGFAGPWQSANEDFKDTSFGIALDKLRRAKASWKERGRDVQMTALLVERNSTAFSKLQALPSKFPEIAVKPYKGDFIELIPTILKDIPHDAFAFFLIDPKGWHIPLKKLQPLLTRPKSEIIFNFMFEFINRAASMKDANIVAGLDELIPSGDWRTRLDGAHNAEERKAILTDTFSECLKKAGGYAHVCETTILRPLKDRALYCLFYATRHETGLEVFRDCQVKALETQSITRGLTKIDHAEQKTGQTELFQSLNDMNSEEVAPLLAEHRSKAELLLLEFTPTAPNAILYKKLWPLILAQCVVRKTDVNRITARLRKEGKLIFPDWELRKQVPQADYRVQRP
ncbi:three-Cys-motif partner protein TcmP [Rhodopseudomonas pseudopalustris]|nr:three-Cys-motif partner protein TcmP [Rhodopseudomonas pseudopalustris]